MEGVPPLQILCQNPTYFFAKKLQKLLTFTCGFSTILLGIFCLEVHCSLVFLKKCPVISYYEGQDGFLLTAYHKPIHFTIIFGCILILVYIKCGDLAFNRFNATLCRVYNANRCSRCCRKDSSRRCGSPLDRCRRCRNCHHACTC